MKKILVVDDDDSLRITLSQLLKEIGYRTLEVSSGARAIEALSTEEFDLVLLDMMMPGIKGIDTLPVIKKLKPKIPVVVLTAFPSTDEAVNAIKRGASDYISKPYKIDELILRINRAIEEAKMDTVSKLPFSSLLVSLSNPIRRNIVKLVSSNQSLRLMDIARSLDISDHTKVSFHLRVLKEEGMIRQDEAKAYVITEEGEKTLSRLDFLENFFSE